MDCFPFSFVNLKMFKKSIKEIVRLMDSQTHAVCACVYRHLCRTQGRTFEDTLRTQWIPCFRH